MTVLPKSKAEVARLAFLSRVPRAPIFSQRWMRYMAPDYWNDRSQLLPARGLVRHRHAGGRQAAPTTRQIKFEGPLQEPEAFVVCRGLNYSIATLAYTLAEASSVDPVSHPVVNDFRALRPHTVGLFQFAGVCGLEDRLSPAPLCPLACQHLVSAVQEPVAESVLKPHVNRFFVLRIHVARDLLVIQLVRELRFQPLDEGGHTEGDSPNRVQDSRIRPLPAQRPPNHAHLAPRLPHQSPCLANHARTHSFACSSVSFQPALPSSEMTCRLKTW